MDFSLKGSMTTKYRTGVVNDFSIVDKAVFHILSPTSMGNMVKWNLEDSLPVQINPDQFSYTSDTQVNMIGGIGPEGENHCATYHPMPSDDQRVSIVLKYDIYDEYMIGTNDGASLSSVSLFDPERTSLPKLISYASSYNRPRTKGLNSNKIVKTCYAMFVWGSIEYFGQLTGVSCDYTAFSRWGDPLKCTATVNMILEERLSNNIGMNTVYGQIKSYSSASHVANKIALGMTAALQ